MPDSPSSPRPRRVTMAEVAAAAGVSVMTVSYTYSQPDRVSADTREKVRRSAEALGYRGPDPAARSLRRGRTDNLGVVMGDLTYAFDDPQASRFLSGVAAVCVEHQLGLTLVPVTGDPDDDVERVGEAAVDGFILWSVIDDDPVREAALASGRPVALHGGTPREPLPAGTAVITIDNRAAAAEVGALAFAAARRPAIVSFPLRPGQTPGIERGVDIDAVTMCNTRERLRGFRSALEAAGHRWDDIPVAVVARNDRAGSRALIGTLLAAAEPDAVAAMSDELALAVLDDLPDQTGPGRVAVTGWDDSPAAEAAGLTTVHQSLHDQGVRCGQWVVGPPIASVASLAPPAWEVVVRRSTQPPAT